MAERPSAPAQDAPTGPDVPDLPASAQGLSRLLGTGALGSLLVFGLAALGGLLLNTLLARHLGASAYGDYAFAFAAASPLIIVAGFGFSSASVRYIPGYLATGASAKALGFRHVALGTTAASASVVLLLGTLLLNLFEDTQPESRARALWAILWVIPVAALLETVSSFLQALHRPALARALASALHPALLALGVLLVGMTAPESITVPAVLHATAAACVLALALGWVAVLRLWPSPRVVADPSDARVWRQGSLVFLAIACFMTLTQHIDVLMVGSFGDSEQAGTYAVASRISMLATFGLTAVNAAMGPILAGLYARNEHAQLQRMLTLGARASAALAVCAALGFAVLGRWVLALFGPGFGVAYVPMLVLTAGHVFNALMGSPGVLLTVSGRHGQVAWLVAASFALNVGLNWVLIPRWGGLGAALGTAAATVVWNVLLVSYVARLYKLDTSVLGIRRPG